MKTTFRASALAALILAAGLGCRLVYPVTWIDPANVRTILNPYGTNPLVALLDIASAQGIVKNGVHTVTLTLTGPSGSTASWTIPYGTRHYLKNYDTSDLRTVPPGDIVVPVLGLYADAVTSVALEITDDTSRKKFTCTTSISTLIAGDTEDRLHDGYPNVLVSTANTARMEPGMTLVSFSMGDNGRFATRPFVIDQTGAIRWALRLDTLGNWASPVERLQNGNLVFGRGEFVYEYSMLGRQVHAWDIGRYGFTQHHDVYEIRKGPRAGNLIVAVDTVGLPTVEDHVIEIDRTGKLVTTWDLRQILDMDRFDLLKNPSDWFHMNAVLHDARDDTLIVSGRNQGIVKVDGANRLRWIIAPHKGWGSAGPAAAGPETSDFLLTAVSSSNVPFPAEVQDGLANVDGGRTFDWVWGQHSPELLPNGNLLVFDNGFNRLFSGQEEGFSRAVEYRVDEASKTIAQIWQYGAERGKDFYSSIISDVDSLPGTKNRLITSGSIRDEQHKGSSLIAEVTFPGGVTVFEATMRFKDAHSNPAAGGWGNMDIVFRAERFSLFPGAAEGRR